MPRYWDNSQIRDLIAQERLDLRILAPLAWGSATSKPTVKGKEREEWSLLGVDFRTGELMYRLPLFRGERHTHYDNAWGTLSLGPEDALYLGMWNGCVRVADPKRAA